MNNIKNLKPSGPYTHGIFTPLNQQKYIGDTKKIIYRSSYEKIFYMLIDLDPAVKRWAAESMRVQYISPIDKKVHNYYPDVYVEKEVKGKIEKIIVEIKPSAFLVPPKKKGDTLRQKKKYLDALRKFVIIQAKKRATEAYAAKAGYVFTFVTEKYTNKFDIEKLESAYKKDS